MHSCALLRKSSPLIRRVVQAQRLNTRPISTQSNGPLSSPPSSSSLKSFGESSYNEDKRSESILESFLKSLISSGVVVVGSTLGLCYWSSLSDTISFLSYADSGDDTTEPEKKPKFLFGDAYRKKVFFKYEKRIRLQSPPEKVFEYFASFRTPSGEVFMTPADLMRAVVPVFPPSETTHVRGGYLKGELNPGELHCAPSEFFMLFDTNNDGLISFAEYIFFVTLLSIPESSFSVAFKMFDLDNNGEIDVNEFKKVMGLMRTHNRQGARHRDGLRIGLKVSGSVENGGVLEYFFGKDGKKCLQHGKFVQFLRDLHEEILRLEFAHYDYKSRGTISAKDFALSMVASADMKHINKFLDRVDELNNEPHVKDIRITFEEFKNYAELRKSLRPLSLAIFSYGSVNGQLTKEDFQRAAYQVCGISLTDNVVDMIFYVFDADRDGSLSSDEFVRVLQRREKDMSHPREAGFSGLISCWVECTKNSGGSKSVF
ncbi:calcium uptake protein, mitochondrial-like [Cornus florida]|uniref:calcium uptake protein, mitochondrial-like n=1 Tax=Cornus florida TaxID=4283 RepID=UPI002899C934|nr:calcium uptake protein, mitochondrial-like [Cornus florida]XP_059637846.1 calcium uptake protein, mitochondrial-like [Cornus florida]